MPQAKRRPSAADAEQERARTYVREILAETGWSPTELARKAGLAPSTLNRFLNQEVKHTLSRRSIAKIAEAAGKAQAHQGASKAIAQLEQQIADLPEGREREQLLRSLAEIRAHEALGAAMQSWDLYTARAKSANLSFMPVRGTVEAGAWREAMEWPQEDWYPVGVAGVERYTALPQFGLVVRGPSMNLVYPEGSILACVSFLHLGREPKSGERVIVEHRRGDLVEATVKEFVVEQGRGRLYARSDNPRYAGVVDLPAPGETAEIHDDAILVTALVIASIRPEATA